MGKRKLKRNTREILRQLQKDDLQPIDLVVIAHAVIKARERAIERIDEDLFDGNEKSAIQAENYARAFNRVLLRLRHPAAIPEGQPLPTDRHAWNCRNCDHRNSHLLRLADGRKLLRLVCPNCKEPRVDLSEQKTG